MTAPTLPRAVDDVVATTDAHDGDSPGGPLTSASTSAVRDDSVTALPIGQAR